MRHRLILSAALFAASAARAANVVYEHPALKVRLTVHSEGSAAPDALSYEGPKGFYLITTAELSSLEHGDGYSDIRYDVRALSAEGFLSEEASYVDAKPCRLSDDACVAAVEKTIDELVFRGKQEAPDEFAARLLALHHRASAARSTWRSYAAEAEVLDRGALDAVAKPLADAAASVESARAGRAADEYRASVAIATPAEPSPKADFYCRQNRVLDAASETLSRVSATLQSERIPNY